MSGRGLLYGRRSPVSRLPVSLLLELTARGVELVTRGGPTDEPRRQFQGVVLLWSSERLIRGDASLCFDVGVCHGGARLVQVVAFLNFGAGQERHRVLLHASDDAADVLRRVAQEIAKRRGDGWEPLPGEHPEKADSVINAHELFARAREAVRLWRAPMEPRR